MLAKPSSMVYFSDAEGYQCHRVRIVLKEKDIQVEMENVPLEDLPEEVLANNPYGSLPFLAERELYLYDPSVMIEFLDDRFPHPPLLPVYPVEKAKCRQLIKRITKSWDPLVDAILDPHVKDKATNEARRTLKDELIGLDPLFEGDAWFLTKLRNSENAGGMDDYSLLDCVVSPILWRLPLLGIKITDKQAPSLVKYMKRLFEREAFQASLTDYEQAIERL